MTVPPSRPPSDPAPPPDPSASRHSRTETTRLLCAGPYLRAHFRRRVVAELVEQSGRTVAPSAGADVVPVPAHALRARSLELRAGGWTALLGVLFLLADHFGDRFGWMTSWSLALAYDESFVEQAFFLPTDALGGLDGSRRYPGSGIWAWNYAIVCLLLWAARKATGRGTGVYSLDGLLGGGRRRLLALVPQVLMALYWMTALVSVWNRSATGW